MAFSVLSAFAYRAASSLSNKFVLTDTSGVISYLKFFNQWLGNAQLSSDHYSTVGNLRVWNIDAGWGNDHIDASQSTGNNRLAGGHGNDTIIGGTGNDRIDGGACHDDLTGGAGSDVFVLSAGKDIIRDFEPTTRTQLTIDFSELSSTGPAWSGFMFGNPAFGVQGSPSGQPVAYAYGGVSTVTGAFYQPDANKDFDFVEGHFSRIFFSYTSNLTIKAYDNGVLVGTANVGVDSVNMKLVKLADHSDANNRFTSIDRVEITGNGATMPGFAMDDLVLMYEEAGDVIDVADGTDVAALMASAQTDGSGGTILTHSQGTVNLVGVNPGDVSADWFV